MYTSDKESTNDRCIIIKYADDTVIIGLLNDKDNPDDNCYFNEITSFAQWCKDNYLDLNVKKTKEMIVDFRVKKQPLNPVMIDGKPVDIVHSYKYLGTIIDDKLNGCENAKRIYKKANQRLFFVRKLKKVHVDKSVMSLFYQSIVESVICFCITSWYGNCTCVDKKKLKRIIRCAQRLGCNVHNLNDLYESALKNKLERVLDDETHPLYDEFKLLPSGNRLSSVYCRTNRFKNSFVPAAIRIHNKSKL